MEETAVPAWPRRVLVVSGVLVGVFALVAAARVPVADSSVWLEASTVAVSALVLVAAAWWMAGRSATIDRRTVLLWGLGWGFGLGALWIAEIAFNNVTPPTVSTASNRGVVDNVTWAVVGLATFVTAAWVTVRTGRWRSGLRAGVWSGVGSGLGASLGGAALLAFLRSDVERDPLMLSEWQQRASDMDLATYVTRETMAGVGGHLWVLGIAQGAVVGLAAASLGIVVVRLRGDSRPTAARSAQ
ncbi:hypothetical protein [Dactylosporangium sp. NPDC005555]|uniref:hypothetical protein n=1 Tax=Dactylosporangium sp. NPDC005555 TaxID=3154889 RepID=UPI0033B112D2